jgi:hypothetical protein
MRLAACHPLIAAWAWGLLGLGAWSAIPVAGQSTAPAGSAPQTPPPPSATKLVGAELDALLSAASPRASEAGSLGDADFLRRLSFDLLGRQPTLEEQQQFAQESSPHKYADWVERLLAREEFGANWADYWCDVIAFHVPPPELTYLDYKPLKKWLAVKLNGNMPWDEVVRDLITAKGKIQDQPAATLVGYHQANATNLAAETSRIFLGQQIGCAQCHDHPFGRWKRTQFHELAAFFARTKAKLPWNDGPGTVVSALDKGEYLMPDAADPLQKGTEVRPAFLDGKTSEIGPTDDHRRARLAEWVTARDNPWFARAYVNRIWARLMGRGFYEPVDDLGEARPREWPAVHEALAAHFTATNFDVKDLIRVVVGTEAYRRSARLKQPDVASATEKADAPLRLRGDEVFAALRVSLEIPDVTPPAVEATAAVRFPPPPKSTRDLVNEAFGTDPSLESVDAPRTIDQALWMMNNEQLQKHFDASPASGTVLARLLEEHKDDGAACRHLFARVLARQPTAGELRIALEHVAHSGDRRAAFEDLLWSLVNSAEFTTRR